VLPEQEKEMKFVVYIFLILSLAGNGLQLWRDRHRSPAQTDSEIFRLRNECARLGEKIEAERKAENHQTFGTSENHQTFVTSENHQTFVTTHYDAATARCYAEVSFGGLNIDDYVYTFLLDAQTEEQLASTVSSPTYGKDKGDINVSSKDIPSPPPYPVDNAGGLAYREWQYETAHRFITCMMAPDIGTKEPLASCMMRK
jgi:hypothetical protein